ncbi:SDR family oxidoreductase [Amycolatopsis sp. PS_44_ISF1]|uniref:SDR family oxidoreductase n=1 Tax=Amycolatopsis sp. PS_44_ISF1 TaxID=2974917 RepID=UPI0028DDBE00|nr:SDR family oxidoreductase [Amycolatopsis sp. PS_44_ISF1]MDT8915212.1 SDR family oxidoreductase [Amycolatopsis sp. PS_44_ISF1]
MSTHPVAVVTGAGRGIGAAAAVALGRRGYRIVVNYFSRAEDARQVVEAVRAAGGDGVAVAGDVRDPEQAARLVDTALTEFGQLDALVCNAATPVRFTPFGELAWNELATKVTDELAAAFHVTAAALEVMTAQGHGRLVFVSSDMATHSAVPSGIAHGTAKAALDAFARYLAVEYGPSGITANVVAPGYVRTDSSAANAPAGRIEAIRAHTPMRRVAVPDDVGRVIAAFADDTESFVTGTVVPVTGGLHAAR